MDENSSDQTDLEKKQRRRPWLIMGGIAAFLLAVLGCVFTFYDGPLPDDSDMMPTWPARLGDANPLAKLCDDLKTARVNTRRTKKIPSRTSSSPPHSVEPEINLVSEDVAMLDSLLQTDPATWQWPDPVGTSAEESYDNLKRIHHRASIFDDKAQLLLKAGKPSEAVNVCLQYVKLGNCLGQPWGETRHITIAREIMTDGLESLRKVLTKGETPPELLAQCQAALAPLEGPGREQMARALKVRYQQFREAILQRNLALANEVPNEPDFEDRLTTTFYLKPHRTLTQRLPMEREWQQLFRVGWTPTIQSIGKFRDEMDNAPRKSPWARLLNPNGYGKEAALYGALGSGTHVHWALKRRCHLQQAKIILALRRHELEKGSLPARLEDLVPTYLAEVPTDEFSGAPMKWNATTSVVYSVGLNFKDDGGHFVEDSNPARWKDVSAPYWWSEAAKTIERY